MKKESPLLSAIAFVEELRSLMRKFNLSIVSMMGILIVVAILSDVVLPFALDLLISLGLLVALLFIYRHFFSVTKKITVWEGRWDRFTLNFKYEFYVPYGKSPQERAFNQLVKVWTTLGNCLNKFLKSYPLAYKDFLNVKVQGAEREHLFDVFINDELLKGKKSQIAKEARSKLRKYGSVFVERFDRREPIKSKDLMKVRAAIVDVIKKTKSRVAGIVIVSSSPFAKSAKAYVKKKENRIKGCSFDLIEEKPSGYTVVWLP